MIYASQFQGYFLQPSSYILLCCSSLQSKYIVYVSINLCTFRKDPKGQQCVFILCMRNNMTTHCVLPTTTMRTAGSTGMLKAQIYGCILHATHSNSLTHTHTDVHSRKQRRSDWRGAAEKNAAITQKVVCKISERSREQKPQLPCCCCCGCCPYSWLYCFSQLWASCGPSQGAGGSQFKRRMSLQWFAELLRRKVCYDFY